ncbi:MAG TPA: hypothetical protein VLJ37_05835 [bacterium]|nr:hypothetical protein [bacterium]
MSITITVRPKDAASGGKDQTIEGDGAIDTKEEAEAALTYLPEGSTDTVVAGKDTYTREKLIEIRDGKKDAPKDGGGVNDGVNHGIALKGNGYGGVSDPAHGGGGFSLTYVPGIPLLTGDTRLFLDPSFGFRLNSGSMDYQLPGGGEASSSFLSYGATLGAALRLVPPVLDHRLWAGLGVDFGIAGFSSPDSEMVSLPPSCTPGDFGRGECEPGAGPRSGNAGTKGLFNPRVGNSRGASGVALDFDIPLTVGVDIARGDWGNLGLFAQFIPGVTGVLPGDGDGFSFWRVGGGGGVAVRFGGSAVEKKPAADVKPKKADGEKPVEIKGATIDATVSAADDAQQFTVKFNPPVTGEVKGASIVDAKGKKVTDADVDPTKLNQTGEVVVKPKTALTAGEYTVVIEMTVDGKPAVAKAALKVAGDFKVADFATSLRGDVQQGASYSVEQKLSSEATLTVVYVKKTDTGRRGAIAGKDDTVGKMSSGTNKRENLPVKPDLPAGEYFVDFVYEKDGVKVVRTTSIKVAEKPKTVEAASLRKTGSNPYLGDGLSVWVTLEREALEDTPVEVVVGNAKKTGTVKKGQKESEEIVMWSKGYGNARSAAGSGEHVIQATPKGGKTLKGDTIRVPGGGGGPVPPKKDRKVQ